MTRLKQTPVAAVTVNAVQYYERGFVRPELNEHALRDLHAAIPAGCTGGVSSNRICEIGLSEMAGVPYESILCLVERCSTAPATGSAGERTSAAAA